MRERPFATWRYISLDDFDVLNQAQADPEALLTGRQNLVLDEVQRAPGILNAMKIAVYRGPAERRFALSGSANLMLMSKVTESLAGRALSITLEPMTMGEQRGARSPTILGRLLQSRHPKEGAVKVSDPFPLMQKGFMPPLMTRSGEDSFVRWSRQAGRSEL